MDVVTQLDVATPNGPFERHALSIWPPATLAGAMAKICALDFHVCPPVDLPLMSSGSL